jgi:RHS repeat-associated protein
VVAAHDYKPFGEDTGALTGDPRRFTGKELDAETALHYFGARYYRNVWGRFTTADPEHVGGNIQDPQSWNAYAYARNNPLRFVDPDGQDYMIHVEGFQSVMVTDAEFARLEGNPGPGIWLRGGFIFALRNNELVRVGTYRWFYGLANMFQDAGNMAAAGVKEGVKEMAIGAAIAATGGLAAGVYGGGLAATSTLGLKAPSMTELANVTPKGARMANFGVNLTAGEFQSNLVRSGYKVIRQGVGPNGPWTMLGSGEKTYTIYTATSTGGPAAEVRVAGRLIGKIRLGGF